MLVTSLCPAEPSAKSVDQEWSPGQCLRMRVGSLPNRDRLCELLLDPPTTVIQHGSMIAGRWAEGDIEPLGAALQKAAPSAEGETLLWSWDGVTKPFGEPRPPRGHPPERQRAPNARGRTADSQSTSPSFNRSGAFARIGKDICTRRDATTSTPWQREDEARSGNIAISPKYSKYPYKSRNVGRQGPLRAAKSGASRSAEAKVFSGFSSDFAGHPAPEAGFSPRTAG